MAISINLRTYTLIVDGIELATVHQIDELVGVIIAHKGKGYANLANRLCSAIEQGKDTTFMEKVIDIEIRKDFSAIAA